MKIEEAIQQRAFKNETEKRIDTTTFLIFTPISKQRKKT